jgi:hypothetical protein
MTFHLEDTYVDFFKKAHEFKPGLTIYSKAGSAYGSGAVRQYMQTILTGMIDHKVLSVKGFFLRFNPESDFLNNKQHMMTFCKLIESNVAVQGTLPFHLGPHILELLIGPMDQPILEYFYEKIHPEGL